MLRYVVRRLLYMVFVLWIISVVTFVMFFMIGNDPAQLAMPRGSTPQALEQVRERMGLNEPKHMQYWHFLTRGPCTPECRGLMRWPPSFGYSFKNDEPVLDIILDRAPVTASLAFGAAFFWLLMGVPVGILAATKPRSIRDRVATTIALTGVSMPSFFLGLIVLYVFFYKLSQTGLRINGNVVFPTGYYPFRDNPLIWAQHLAMPWFTLATVYAAYYSRMVRGSLLEVLGEDYIRTARAKGLSERRVTYRHGLRAALTPVVTLLGLDLGGLLGGAVISEKIFTLPGLGSQLITSLESDLPVIVGIVMFASFFIVMANIIVDVVYAALDPRVRLG